ncbi:hypothetical protein BLAT2472_20506 [Burkholderia latens]
MNMSCRKPARHASVGRFTPVRGAGHFYPSQMNVHGTEKYRVGKCEAISIRSFLARTGATNKKPLVDIIELIVQ